LLAWPFMQPVGRLAASEDGLLFEVDPPGERAIDVLVEGRRFWSFREPAEPAPPALVPPGWDGDRTRFVAWPPIVRPYLDGRFRVGLQAIGCADAVEVTAVVGTGTGAPALADVFGRPLVVNKWGRLGHTLADAPPGLVDRMLDHMDEIRDLLTERLGPVVFVTGGTLLGPVRGDGALILHDDDADLAYLSDWSHPADVARENFEIGRLLCERGYEVIRLSAAHVQMHFDHEGVPDHYVDVFAGFLIEDWWYQHFAIRAQVPRERVLPVSTVVVEGRREPAPRDQELMLTELFGPGWRDPDPAFTFDLPHSMTDRFKSWFGDIHVDRESWEDLVLMAPPATRGEDRASAFADWVDRQTPGDHRLLELGSGLGGDARALGARGRYVRGVDFSRMAVRQARAGLSDPPPPVSFDVVNVFDLRAVLRLGAECAAEKEPWTVFGRRFLNAVDHRGREHVFRLCAMLLRRGGAACFDLITDSGYAGVPEYLQLRVDQVVAEAGRHGLVLEEATPHSEPVAWIGAPEEQAVELTRMTLRRRPR
jgi:hypothetical protein